MQFKRQSNIGCNCAGREQMQLLKDNAHLPALPTQLGIAQAGPIATSNPDLACVRFLQPRNAAQQRGLAGTAQAQHAMDSPGGNLQIDGIQRRSGRASKSLGQAANVDGRRDVEEDGFIPRDRLHLGSAL
jgi:hypothetical protein